MRSRFPRRSKGLLTVLAAVTLVVALPGCGRSAMSAIAAAELNDDRPAKLAKLPDGRLLNFRCVGRGSPTVILESGWDAWSSAWWRVQPVVSAETRVCSYDRAGYGFSSPGPLPRDGAAIARDLDQGLEAAGIKGPFVLVGHSAGGLYARLFAGRRLKEVQGLVLVDVTIERRAPAPPGWQDGLGGMRRRKERCLAAAQAPDPDIGSPAFAGCIGANPTVHQRALALQPANWENQLSELNEIYGRSSDEVNRLGGVLSGIPAYVLTASDSAAASAKVQLAEPASLWELLQQDLASRFRPGYQRTVYSSHLMFKDRPEVVSAAILDMVRAVRAHQAPPPLAPSETEPAPSDAATSWSGPDAPR
jgi:pimeloyl-ACP methyl ester carboxylesterase